jgi:hypothetical protein
MYDTTNYVLKVEGQDYKINLARTGGQGSRGNSVTNATIDANHDLIITISDSAGNVVETINAGNITPSLEEVTSINAMTDVTITAIQSGDILQHNGTQFVNHSLTTSKISDVDNTNLADGSLYVYNGTTNKHTATTQINNSNTTITGGSF